MGGGLKETHINLTTSWERTRRKREREKKKKQNTKPKKKKTQTLNLPFLAGRKRRVQRKERISRQAAE